jgi:hypothetical protein
LSGRTESIKKELITRVSFDKTLSLNNNSNHNIININKPIKEKEIKSWVSDKKDKYQIIDDEQSNNKSAAIIIRKKRKIA